MAFEFVILRPALIDQIRDVEESVEHLPDDRGHRRLTGFGLSVHIVRHEPVPQLDGGTSEPEDVQRVRSEPRGNGVVAHW